MNKREELLVQATAMKLLVDAVAAMILKPTEETPWDEVEKCRRELCAIGAKLHAYTQAVDNHLCENTPLWAEQWDKASEVFTPWNDPDNKYNPDDIDIPALAKEFEEKGLCKELAEATATTIKYPQLG